eukprot:TRINITY_DN3707_c0_g2_i2.p1 TRINITY_DN3707_c0_g2~~TRINITY_DN3707_c0_g2_i2.p1  ORF type:complete len:270 (+),score=56.58 TRINITY_DN3707_c0_g2_i2:415-1224(+)
MDNMMIFFISLILMVFQVKLIPIYSMVISLIELLYPESVHLIGGNHELYEMTKSRGYTFESEIKAKYGEEDCGFILKQFRQTFQVLPLGIVFAEKVFICHGGLPELEPAVDLKRWNKLPDTSAFLSGLLWNDPIETDVKSVKRVRGTFGPETTNKFFAKNKIELMIRSHEYQWSGTKTNHDGKVITVFSASNYGIDNYGAILIFDEELNYSFKRYSVPKAHNKRKIAMVHDILDNIIDTSIGNNNDVEGHKDADECNKDADGEILQVDW